jgi:hypothetical protein
LAEDDGFNTFHPHLWVHGNHDCYIFYTERFSTNGASAPGLPQEFVRLSHAHFALQFRMAREPISGADGWTKHGRPGMFCQMIGIPESNESAVQDLLSQPVHGRRGVLVRSALSCASFC